jgi:hypothetical protein
MATAEDYATWLVQNKDKQGTDEFNTVAEAYKRKRAESAVPSVSAASAEGQKAPEWAQRTLQYANALGFGLVPKMLKASGAPESSQFVSGATEQFVKEHPKEAFVSELVGSLPAGELGAIGTGARAVKAAPIVSRIFQSAAPATVFGGLQAAGKSEGETSVDIMADAARGAALSGILGAGATGVGSIFGAVGRNVGARGSQRIAANEAQKELSKALYRDVPSGSIFETPGVVSTPAGRGIARLQTLGPEARVVDIGGESTRRLADLLTTLPGKAQRQFQTAVEQRQAGRAGRLVTAADEALGTSGAQYGQTLGELETRKVAESKPFYDQLRDVTIPVDDELFGMLKSAGNEALKKSQRLARLAGEDQLSISNALKDTRDLLTNVSIPGTQVNFNSLDHVKQALYDLEQKFAKAGENQESAAFGSLRKRLTAKLDSMSPVDDAGISIYRQARNAYAGPAQLADAVESGRNALSGKTVELSDVISNLSDSEMEGFRIGALQALREKVGKEAGQTELLKMWKEPATSDKLKLIFGDNYRQFAADVAKERQLKMMEKVGQGSKTASMLFGAQDLGMPGIEAAGQAATAAKTGDIGSLVTGAKKLVAGTAMPEATRNQLARLLLARGPQAQQELTMLDQIMANANAAAAARARRTGALLGSGASYNLFNNQ